MNEAALLVNFLVVGAALFAMGVVGFLVRRNMIVIFLSAEMMLQGISLSFVAWSRFHNDWGGQMLVLFIIAVAAAEAGIALALILMLYQRCHSLDAAFWQDLREEGQPPIRDHTVPDVPVEPVVWPRLTPAGRQPEIDEDEQLHRSKV
ncbi:MAG: NADH-quinone oxidoreductase subunit NuoK [Pirellulaceae bacterium]